MFGFAQETEEPSVLLLLPECAATAAVCSVWQDQVHVEDRRLCGQACRRVHHRTRHGGE